MALKVNHSTIFRRLKAYEQAIEGKLFERHPSGYQLTSLGHELFELAQNIENSFDDLDRRIVSAEIQPKGCIKVTAPNNIAYRYLPSLIARFNRKYPDILVELLVSNQDINMSNRQADIAIRATQSPPEHLVGTKVASLSWGVYSSDGYTTQNPAVNEVADLANHKLIGAAGALTNLSAFTWQSKAFSSQITLRCDDLTAMSYLAQSAQGLALLPDDQSRPQITRLLTLPSQIVSDLWVLTHPDLRNVTRIKLFMQFLCDAFAEQWPLVNK